MHIATPFIHACMTTAVLSKMCDFTLLITVTSYLHTIIARTTTHVHMVAITVTYRDIYGCASYEIREN